MKEVLKKLNLLLKKHNSILDCVNDVLPLREALTTEEDVTIFVNKVRAIVQKEATQAVINAGGRGLVAMATGSGKSKVAIDLLKHYNPQGSKYDNVLVVPTEKLRDENWKEEFSKWKGLSLYDKTEKLCYASGSKIEDFDFNTCILDECHNMTELASELFSNNHIENVIALTATVPNDKEKLLIFQRLGIHVVYSLTLDNAVKLGFVAPYKITVVHTKLDNVIKNVQSGSKDKPFFQTELAKYNYLSTLCLTRPGQISTFNRMRFIYNLESKFIAAQYILNNHINKEDRTLIFCGSIEKAEKICKETFHSKSGDTFYNAFKKDEIKKLSCVKAINEGHNFIGLDGGLILQLNSKEKDLIQRIGRLIRFRPGHEAHIWIIVCDETQDKVWSNTALANFDQSKIEHISYESLKQKSNDCKIL
jgi:superfamily II DNA or RNA helicase